MYDAITPLKLIPRRLMHFPICSSCLDRRILFNDMGFIYSVGECGVDDRDPVCALDTVPLQQHKKCQHRPRGQTKGT